MPRRIAASNQGYSADHLGIYGDNCLTRIKMNAWYRHRSACTFQPVLFLWSSDVSERRLWSTKTFNEAPYNESEDARPTDSQKSHGRTKEDWGYEPKKAPRWPSDVAM